MLRRPPIATRTDTLFPYTTLFRSMGESLDADVIAVRLTGPFRFVVAAAPAYIARYGRPETPGDLREHRCVRLRLGTGAMMPWTRSEEHTSELQSLMRISYAVFCLKKKKKMINYTHII